MKNFSMVCVAAVLTLGISVAASAADRAVSKAGLNKMGFGSVRALSDKEGTAIRGKGTFAFVAGNSSTQTFNGPVSTAVYAAGSSHYYGPAFATGTATSVTTTSSIFGPVTSVAVTSSSAAAF